MEWMGDTPQTVMTTRAPAVLTKRWSWSVRNLWVYYCCNVCGFQGIWIVIWSLFGENQIFALFSEKLSVCICDKVFRRNIKARGDEVRVS